MRVAQSFDLNQDGRLNREEFEELVRQSMPGLVKRIVIHVAVYCTAVPVLVFLTKACVTQASEKWGRRIPGGLLATLFTVAFKASGILRN